MVAQDPATIETTYGITGVLGPWSGKLSSGGEEIELRDTANSKLDSVEYRAGFPWPAMADGGGPSAELIHPSLANSRGSAWRSGMAASATTYLDALATGWRYFKGVAQAPTPDGSWRAPTYDDRGWSTGQAGFGYGNYGGHNYRFYHRPSDGRWVIIAYDLDMMYIPAHHWGGTMDGVVVAGAPNVFRAIMRHPEIAREYRNRCREILSLAGSDGSAGGGQIGQLIAEHVSFVNPPGQEKTWADIDAAMWNLHPRSHGNGSNSGQSSHRGNFFRATFTDNRGGLAGTLSSSWPRTLADDDGDGFSDHEGLMRYFIDYATDTWTDSFWSRRAVNGVGTDPNRQFGYGYKYLEFEGLYGGWGDANNNPTTAAIHDDFPAKPTVSADNLAFTIDRLSFTASAFSDPDGPATHAATRW